MDYAQRYQQLNSRVVYSNYVSNVQRLQLGRSVYVPTVQPYRDASFVPTLKVGEIFTTAAEQELYISRETLQYTPAVVPPSADPPSAPLNVSVTPGSGSVDVMWELPASDGGSPVLYYTIVSSLDGVTVTTSNTSATVSGLINGIEYTFDVTATNSAGTSDATTSSATTPVGSGFATEIFTDVGTITWLAPAAGTIVQYLIVGGGGGGGGGFDTGAGGGGGAGVVLSGTTIAVANTPYNVTIGDGGNGGTGVAGGPETVGSSGNSSVFKTIVALGGSGGRQSRSAPGGNGVGGTIATSIAGGGGGNGGGNISVGLAPGGGGGNGSAGSNGSAPSGGIALGGAGGSGVSNSLSGSPVTYGAGGTGGTEKQTSGGAINGEAGASNTGNGGGGATTGVSSGANGGKGGSGIVIIRYYNP
jgi:hypothetical protein